MMESCQHWTRRMRRLSRIANSGIADTLAEIYRWPEFGGPDEHTLADFGQWFDHVLYVSLSTHDKYILEREIFHCGFPGWRGRDAVERLLDKPNSEEWSYLDDIACKLFYKWSWADGVLRQILGELRRVPDDELPDGDRLVANIAKDWCTRCDEVLPGDRRQRRVDELVNDEVNREFFATLRTDPMAMLEDLSLISVAPHPDDLRTWRLLAYIVTERVQTMCRWPGVHSAAETANKQQETDEQFPGDYYPFYEEWWDEALPSIGPSKTQTSEDHSSEARHQESKEKDEKETGPSATKSTSSPIPTQDTPSSRSRETQMRQKVRAMLDASDVWDVWILGRMLLWVDVLVTDYNGTDWDFNRLERTSCFKDNYRRTTKKSVLNGGFEYYDHMLQRRSPPDPAFLSLPDKASYSDRLFSTYLHTRHFSPLGEPRECIQFVDYSNFTFENITDENVKATLLESLGLDIDECKWDLVVQLETEFDARKPFADQTHLRHALYLTDDMHRRHFEEGYDYPGMCYPCNCKPLGTTDSSDAVLDTNRKERRYPDEHYDYGHQGGCVVFNRRKLEDTEMIRNLDRFWADWNDCLLVFGAGTDEDDESYGLIDKDAVYILETLPGIKARKLRQQARERDYDPQPLAAACLFFNLKWHYRDQLELQQQTLKDLMGNWYKPWYGDFAYFIDPREFDYTQAVLLGRGSYGATYKVPWSRKMTFKDGSVSFSPGDAVLKLVVYGPDDTKEDRAKLFCGKFEALYEHYYLGGRVNDLVTFYGYTKVTSQIQFRKDGRPEIINTKPAEADAWKEYNGCQVFAFVFDYLSGDTPADMDRSFPRFEDDDQFDTWFDILAILERVGEMIKKLKTPHRNIQPNNLLTQWVARRNRYDKYFRRYILAEPSDGLSIYSTTNNVFIAPELKTDPTRHSKATDIYAWAQLGVQLLIDRMYEHLAPETPRTVVLDVDVLEAIEHCLDPDPDKREKAAQELLDLLHRVSWKTRIAAHEEAYGEFAKKCPIVQGRLQGIIDEALEASSSSPKGGLQLYMHDLFRPLSRREEDSWGESTAEEEFGNELDWQSDW